jgi:hypothetical protein
MGLFKKKTPEMGAPVFVDMRIAEEQLPQEIMEIVRSNMWGWGYPDLLSNWAVETFAVANNPKVQIFLKETDMETLDPEKSAHPIYIEENLLKQLVGEVKERDLLFDFEEWHRASVIPFAEAYPFLDYVMQQEGVTKKYFPAVIVPDFSGEVAPPGHDFMWFAILHPNDYKGIDYVHFGNAPMVTHPSPGGYGTGVKNALAIFNTGKAIPGLIRAVINGDYLETDYYLPTEVLEATGWWADEVEGVSNTKPRNFQ